MQHAFVRRALCALARSCGTAAGVCARRTALEVNCSIAQSKAAAMVLSLQLVQVLPAGLPRIRLRAPMLRFHPLLSEFRRTQRRVHRTRSSTTDLAAVCGLGARCRVPIAMRGVARSALASVFFGASDAHSELARVATMGFMFHADGQSAAADWLLTERFTVLPCSLDHLRCSPNNARVRVGFELGPHAGFINTYPPAASGIGGLSGATPFPRTSCIGSICPLRSCPRRASSTPTVAFRGAAP